MRKPEIYSALETVLNILEKSMAGSRANIIDAIRIVRKILASAKSSKGETEESWASK